MKTKPTFWYEKTLTQQGYSHIVGVDEAGCGALAGPVVAGAVILPTDSRLGDLNDSKMLQETLREDLYEKLTSMCDYWAVGSASAEEIGKIGIRPATYLAMRRAIEQIEKADYALVDAWTIPGITIAQQGIIRGDSQVKSIAAASILAKVTRDRLMKQYAEKYPEYGFELHKGYGTSAHRKAIRKHGACKIHRTTFKTFQQTLL